MTAAGRAACGWLDTNDVSPEVSEKPSGELAFTVAQIDDAHRGERTGGFDVRGHAGVVLEGGRCTWRAATACDRPSMIVSSPALKSSSVANETLQCGAARCSVGRFDS